MEVNDQHSVLGYDTFAELPIAKQIVRHFVEKAHIRPGNVVLDIGGGTGDSAAAILERLKTESGWQGKVVSVEPDPTLLAIARRRLEGCPVEFYQGTAQELDRLGFTEKIFDISLWSNGIHYLASAPVLSQALEAIKRVTRTKFVAWSTFVREVYVGKTARFAGLWVATACRLLGVDPKAERVKAENLQERGPADYVMALLGAGFSGVRSALETFELPPEAYEAIAVFADYVRNALPDMPSRPEITLEMRSRALLEAVRPVYERLGVATLPRKWLYLDAEV